MPLFPSDYPFNLRWQQIKFFSGDSQKGLSSRPVQMAAEFISERADSSKDDMEITQKFKGAGIRGKKPSISAFFSAKSIDAETDFLDNNTRINFGYGFLLSIHCTRIQKHLMSDRLCQCRGDLLQMT